MQPIYVNKEYRITRMYAQTVSSNHPIPPTSKTRGKWMVYKRYSRAQTHHIPHKKDMYQLSIIKEIHNFPKTTVIS